MRPARLVLATLSLLAAVVIANSPAAAVTAPAPGRDDWLAETGAHTARATASYDRAGPQQSGPAWLRRASVKAGQQDGLQTAYECAATRTRAQGDGRWPGERFTQDPASGQAGNGLGLDYRPQGLDQNLTLELSGRTENHGLEEHQRFGITLPLRPERSELGTSAYDPMAGAKRRTGSPARRL